MSIISCNEFTELKTGIDGKKYATDEVKIFADQKDMISMSFIANHHK